MMAVCTPYNMSGTMWYNLAYHNTFVMIAESDVVVLAIVSVHICIAVLSFSTSSGGCNTNSPATIFLRRYSFLSRYTHYH